MEEEIVCNRAGISKPNKDFIYWLWQRNGSTKRKEICCLVEAKRELCGGFIKICRCKLTAAVTRHRTAQNESICRAFASAQHNQAVDNKGVLVSTVNR